MSESCEYIFAPLKIITLNRDVHLKRCIKSLQSNTWAPYTELYISVDYPPSEKYEKGYQKVCEYLKQGITGFKKVHVYYQEHNLGPRENSLFLNKTIEIDGHTCYISIEDDMEFSPCYIEFMDKGLTLFKDDNDVIAITPFNHLGTYPIYGDTIVKSKNIGSGAGYWFDKMDGLLNDINKAYYDLNRSLIKRIKIFRNGSLYSFYVNGLLLNQCPPMFDDEGRLTNIDVNKCMLMALDERKCTILPTVSLARNWGYDGTGVNCGKFDKWSNMPLSESIQFDYIYEKPLMYKQKVAHIERTINRPSVIENIKLMIKAFIVRTFGINVWNNLNKRRCKYKDK